MKKSNSLFLAIVGMSVISVGVYAYDTFMNRKELKKQTALLKEIKTELSDKQPCNSTQIKKDTHIFHHPV